MMTCITTMARVAAPKGTTPRNAALHVLAMCLVTLGWAATPARAADPALLSRAAEVAKICETHMPDSVAAKEAFKASGFRYEGIYGSLYVYSLNNRRLVAATTVTSAREKGCLVIVSKMTPDEARSLIAPWVKTAKAKPIAHWHNDMSAAWQGTFRGTPVRLGVIDKFELRIMRGAAIMAVSKY